MAYWCIDPVDGDDGTGSSQTTQSAAEGTPFKTWNAVGITWTIGDTYLQKRGTTATETVTIGTNGTSGNPIVLDAYGTGEKPIIDCENTREDGIRKVGAEYIEVNNFQVNNVAWGGTADDKRKHAGIYFSQTATVGESCTGVKTIGCVINTSAYNGIMFTPEYGETLWQPCTEMLQQSCEAYDCAGVGVGTKLHTTGGSVQEYNIARRCGAEDNQWGVYCTAWGETIRDDTAWVNTSGDIYRFEIVNGEALLHPVIECYAIGRSNEHLGDIRLLSVGVTTPALNQWHWASPYLYINIGQDPRVGPKSIQILWAVCDNPIMRYNEASDIAGTDGVGMGFDASVRAGRLYGNTSYNNNRGYSLHVTTACWAYGNLAYDCTEKGINCHNAIEHPSYSGQSNIVMGNTFVDVGVGVGLSNSAGVEIYNNIIQATTDIQLSGSIGNSYTADYNLLNVTNNNMFGSNNITTADLKLDSAYKPLANSPAYAAGRIGVRSVNEITNSEDITEAIWTKINASPTADDTTSPSGQTDADTLVDNSATGTGNVAVWHEVTVTSGEVQCFSVYAKADQLDWVALQTQLYDADGTSWFDLTNGVVGTKQANHIASGITDVGNGWYRCYITYTSTTDVVGRNKILVGEANNDIVVDLDGTSSIFVWGAQSEIGSSPSEYISTVNYARDMNIWSFRDKNGRPFKYPPTIGAYEFNRGAPAQTRNSTAASNLLVGSENLANSWANTRSTDSQSVAVSPGGSYTANSLNEDGTASNSHFIIQPVPLVNTTQYTYSVYLKASNRTWVRLQCYGIGSTATGHFNLSTGAAGTETSVDDSGSEDVGNGWYRCWMTFTTGTVSGSTALIAVAEADNDVIFSGLTQESILVWGAQLEAGTLGVYGRTAHSPITGTARTART